MCTATSPSSFDPVAMSIVLQMMCEIVFQRALARYRSASS
jgi:ABC-type uncharacterized transport system permease subunit